MKRRRTFSREFKRMIVEELGVKSIDQVCREYDLRDNMVSRWKKEYLENPREAFKGRGKAYKLQAKVAKYERLIGQLYAEVDFLKKAIQLVHEKQAEKKER